MKKGTPIAYVDFETRSACDLKKRGLHNYGTHESTEVLCLGWALNDSAPQVWGPEDGPLPIPLVDHIHAGLPVVAHNAPFELIIWNRVLRRTRTELPLLSPAQMICTMARAYAMALPGNLEGAASALGLRAQKDMTGHALMMRMCRPVNTPEVDRGAPPKWATDEKEFTFQGERRTPEWAMAALRAYCSQDVAVEREIYKRTQPLSPSEQRVWLMDRCINQRGVGFDIAAVRGALKVKDETLARLDKEMKTVTGGAVQSCNALQALKRWAADYAVYRDSLAAESLAADIDDETLPDEVLAAFQIRQEAGRATSVAKLKKILDLADHRGRVREVAQYHGAGTGRFAGRAIQPHNFPRDLPKPEVVEDIMLRLRTGEALPADQPALTTVSKLLRGFIVPTDGRQFIGGDFSNIEGRVLAFLAGEKWKIDAFRKADKNPDLDVYKQSYAAAFGVEVGNVRDAQRQVGKVMELALGYAGGVGAFQTMAKAYKVEVSDEKADELKLAWREKHPRVKAYWYAMETAAMAAVEHRGRVFAAGAHYARVTFQMNGSFLWLTLPSGRKLCYPYPKLVDVGRGPALSYKTVPDPVKWGGYTKARDAEELDSYTGQVVHEPGNTKSWARVLTYGGKLVENATQAVARDLFVASMMRLEKAGYPVVLHIHDEVVVEGRWTEEDRAKVESLMRRVPAWAKGFPLAAECWLGDRYQK